MDTLFFHCRAGFERECAQELSELFGALEVELDSQATENTGFVFVQGRRELIEKAAAEIYLSDLIFARQWFPGFRIVLPTTDRVSVIVQTLGNKRADVIHIETPDTTEGRELQGLCRGIRAPLEQALKKKNMLVTESGLQFHVCFLSGTDAFVGIVETRRASPEAMGIKRLRLPKDAPSRSTLKLEEALFEFVPLDQHPYRLKPRMLAVDLGAAPGGWTYQMVQRGIRVIAVDNGPMDRKLMDSGQVEHKRADGFTYKPDKKIDWLLCDMVEKPMRVADLLAKWAVQGRCREAIVNFKLPMKKRYDELMRCLDAVAQPLEDQRIQFELRAKHLYHDREEVTVHFRLLNVK